MNDLGVDLKVTVGAATDEGGRAGNEDAILVQPLEPLGSGPGSADAGYLLAVADGMGGHQGGEVASRLAIEALQGSFSDDPGADVALLFKQAFRRANNRIFQDGAAAGEAEMMGTTLVACAIRGKYATIASIGDSRAYLLRANRLTQITQDHTLVAQQVADGTITAEAARSSPHRNVLTQALGHRDRLHSSLPSVFELTLLPEDRLLLCSDGFYDVVNDDDVSEVLLNEEPQTAAQHLVDLAIERQTSDNVSAVVLEAESTRVVLAPVTVVEVEERRSLLVPILVAAVILAVIAAVLAFTLT